ncbi:hypothetical protein EJV47_18205 [Hymenobacter gummosus]|uniref:YtxH domain-containing protein n=1 Tax=Hymenobacter gummosus TaxID=1776032 RepID=A0A3S0JFD7_9BACT|nr:hypothetical protein [Hymenobacter gummosus]RTQ47852.1 hypothetical protein EJV47_18205 [Hymenobacter gummosus]
MTKKLKFVKAQHPAGAATSAEHSAQPRRRGISNKALIGGALLAVGAGALAILGRRKWPAIKQQAGRLKDQASKTGADLKEQAEKAAADFKGQAEQVVADLKEKATGKAADSNGAASGSKAPVDAKLNDEVAKSTKSSPKATSGFTDEGATGNND